MEHARRAGDAVGPVSSRLACTARLESSYKCKCRCLRRAYIDISQLTAMARKLSRARQRNLIATHARQRPWQCANPRALAALGIRYRAMDDIEARRISGFTA